MQILVNTDNHITSSEDFEAECQGKIETTLSKFSDSITRVEVYIHDENSIKGGSDDKKCSIEVRLSGLSPIAVTYNAGTIRESLNGAARKAERIVRDTLDRRKEH